VTRSLTILLPVCNAQATLSEAVHEALEVFAELSDRLELVIVDDGSEDATGEVAEELRRNYPQVRSVYHGAHLGREAAIRSGLSHARGEVVLVRDEQGMAPSEIARRWRAAERGGSALDGAGPGTAEPRHAGYRILRRAPAHAPGGGPGRPNYLARLRAFALGE
jgi:glycosyltransferase involved in cell wall biosynthesis